MATMEGSFTTMPLPRAYTSVLAVPRSMARSLEKMLNSERRLWLRVEPEWNPLFDMTKVLASFDVLFFRGYPGNLPFLSDAGCHHSTGYPATPPQPKVPCPKGRGRSQAVT